MKLKGNILYLYTPNKVINIIKSLLLRFILSLLNIIIIFNLIIYL